MKRCSSWKYTLPFRICEIFSQKYPGIYVTLLHFSSSCLQHPHNNFSSNIYIIQRDYYNIMKHWGLSCCGMPGTEKEMWMEESGCVKLKGKSRERISLVLPYTFYYYSSVYLSRNSISLGTALPPRITN